MSESPKEGSEREETGTSNTSDFASTQMDPVYIRRSKNKNSNNNAETPKGRRVNIRFVIAIVCFIVGFILCIVAGCIANSIWKHDRGGSGKIPDLKYMKFPGNTKHTAEALKQWARDFNDMRAKNSQVKDKIQRVPDEVCQTFEEFPGLYNSHVKKDQIDGGKIEEFQVYYYNFFSMFMFFTAASLMAFVIMFVVAEHLMILKGGEAFESLNKCSLASSVLCSIVALIGCILLAVGVSGINEDFLTKVLRDICKYQMKSMTYAALAPGAVASIFLLVGAPLSFVMYKD